MKHEACWLRVPPKTYLRTLSKNHQQQKARIRDDAPHYGAWCVRVFWHQLGTNAFVKARPAISYTFQVPSSMGEEVAPIPDDHLALG